MTSSERLMYIQFTPCIYGDAKISYSFDNKNGVSDSIQVPLFSTANKIDAMYLTNNYLRLWHRCRSDVSIVNFEQVNVSWEASSKCPIKYLQPIHFKCTFLETYRKLFHSAKCLNFVSIFPFIYFSVDLLRKRRTLWPQLDIFPQKLFILLFEVSFYGCKGFQFNVQNIKAQNERTLNEAHNQYI